MACLRGVGRCNSCSVLAGIARIMRSRISRKKLSIDSL